MNLPLPIRALLWPLSVLYGWAVRFKVLLYDKGILTRKRLNATVISVGNLTVGGTGKTPMVLYLAEKFIAEGKRVAAERRANKPSELPNVHPRHRVAEPVDDDDDDDEPEEEPAWRQEFDLLMKRIAPKGKK